MSLLFWIMRWGWGWHNGDDNDRLSSTRYCHNCVIGDFHLRAGWHDVGVCTPGIESLGPDGSFSRLNSVPCYTV